MRDDMANGEAPVSLRAWARSRRVPWATAQKGAASGRLSRDERGRVVPSRADAEWAASAPPRINGRAAIPPAPKLPETDEDRDLDAVLRDLRDHDCEWAGDIGDDMVSTRVTRCINAIRVITRIHGEMATIRTLAPILAAETDCARIAVLLTHVLTRLHETSEQAVIEWFNSGALPFKINLDAESA